MTLSLTKNGQTEILCLILDSVIFRTNAVIFGTNAVRFRTNPVLFRTAPVTLTVFRISMLISPDSAFLNK